MPKKRPRNDFLDGEAQEDSAEESDTEQKQRAAAMKKLKSSRPSKIFPVDTLLVMKCFFFSSE